MFYVVWEKDMGGNMKTTVVIYKRKKEAMALAWLVDCTIHLFFLKMLFITLKSWFANLYFVPN